MCPPGHTSLTQIRLICRINTHPPPPHPQSVEWARVHRLPPSQPANTNILRRSVTSPPSRPEHLRSPTSHVTTTELPIKVQSSNIQVRSSRSCVSLERETFAKNRARVLDQAAPSFGPGCASFGPGCASFGPGCASFGPGCAQFWTRMHAYLQNVKHSPKTGPEFWTRLRPALDQEA